jgi:hypothetical protein
MPMSRGQRQVVELERAATLAHYADKRNHQCLVIGVNAMELPDHLC